MQNACIISRLRADVKAERVFGLASGEGLDAPHEPLARGARAADEENGVVAREGTEDIGPRLGVDGARDGLGAAGDGADDDQLTDTIDVAEQRREHRLEDGTLLGRGPGPGERVPRALRGGDARDAELA